MKTAMPKTSELASLLGISTPYASQLLGGTRNWTHALAIATFRKAGVKVGPIADMSDEDIDTLDRLLTSKVAA